jgi:hypothetical protein
MKYRIKVKGVLDESWSDWLGGVAITCGEENGMLITTICGDVADQPVLFGILDRIRSLNLPLISVMQDEQSQ